MSIEETPDPGSASPKGAWDQIKAFLPGPDRLKTSIAWLFSLMIVANAVTAFVSATAGILAILFVPFLVVSVLALVNFVNFLFPNDDVGFRKRLGAALLGFAGVFLAYLFIVGFGTAAQAIRRDVPIAVTDWALRNLYELDVSVSASAITPHIPALERSVDVNSAASLIKFQRLSAEVEPWFTNPSGNPSISSIMNAVTMTDRLHLSGTIDLTSTSRHDKILFLGGKTVTVDAGTEIFIGESSLVLVAENLISGTSAENPSGGAAPKIIAFPRSDGVLTGDSVESARAAGNVTIVVASSMSGSAIEIDLRGEDGANGVPGVDGKNGEVVPKLEAYKPDGYSLPVNLGSKDNANLVRSSLDVFKASPKWKECGSSCQIIVASLRGWADKCSQTDAKCPEYEATACLYTSRPLQLDPQSVIDASGTAGGNGGNGQDGGNGGTVTAAMSTNATGNDPITVIPKPDTSNAATLASTWASKGGAKGLRGVAGKPAAVPKIDESSFGGCVIDTSSPFTPRSDGQDGSPGRPGKQQIYHDVSRFPY
ncbi:hypothetical protein ACVIRO_007610 [Rhizobium ruizarguesonis]